MACAPKCSYYRRPRQLLVLANDCRNGDDVIIVPAVSDEDAKQKFPGGWKTLKPYLRVVAQPGKEKSASGD